MLGGAGQNLYQPKSRNTYILKSHRWPFRVRMLVNVLCCINSQEQHDLRRFHKPVSYNQWLWWKGPGEDVMRPPDNFGSASVNLLYDLGHHLASAVFIFHIYKIKGLHNVISKKFPMRMILSLMAL